MDTLISPSYTSAIAQVIQTPSISGMENNMVIFEYDRRYPEELRNILGNVNLIRAGNFDVGILAIFITSCDKFSENLNPRFL
jgi:hypothetical protein